MEFLIYAEDLACQKPLHSVSVSISNQLCLAMLNEMCRESLRRAFDIYDRKLEFIPVPLSEGRIIPLDEKNLDKLRNYWCKAENQCRMLWNDIRIFEEGYSQSKIASELLSGQIIVTDTLKLCFIKKSQE